MTKTLSELVASGRDRDGVLFTGPARSTPYSYHEFCTNVWKAATLLRQYGTHPGSSVAVVFATGSGPSPESERTITLETVQPVLGFLGGVILGAQVDVVPSPPVDARTLVRPAGSAWRDSYETTPRCSTLVYGGSPGDPDVTGFEGALWAQNPTDPPESVDSRALAITHGDREHTHDALLDAVEWTIAEYELDDSCRVGVSADIRRPATLVGGVLAPMAVGATVVLGDSGETTVGVVGQADDEDSSEQGTRIPVTAIEDRLRTV